MCVVFAGSSIPAERGDSDGVGVVETKREEEWDGRLVLPRPQLLGPRRVGALARYAREQGRADPALARPHRLLIHVTNGCNLHLGYNRFLLCERSFAISHLDAWKVKLSFGWPCIRLSWQKSQESVTAKVSPCEILLAGCFLLIPLLVQLCSYWQYINADWYGTRFLNSLLITSSLDSANWTVWMYHNRTLIHFNSWWIKAFVCVVRTHSHTSEVGAKLIIW